MSTHDLLGVGLGPFNLGLAALLDPVAEVDALFLEASPHVSWHPGLMLDDAALQVPHLADLVTLADPTSRHSFLNYLHEHGRLYRFYFAERWHPSRREYQHYLGWVAGRLSSCRFGARVADARIDGGTWRLETTRGEVHRARALVLGVGSSPAVPACAAGLEELHSAGYLGRRSTLLDAPSVTVVGSGQSAAEIVADLLDHGRPDQRLEWFTRSPGFLPMEYSKLGLEHFTPEYTRYFHGLPPETRDRVRSRQDLFYKGISAETSARIYDALYDRSVGGAEPDVHYAAATELVGVDGASGGFRLSLRQREQGVAFVHETSELVLGTGYTGASSPVIGLDALAERDERGRILIGLDHRVALRDPGAPPLFVQNAELHTHGIGTPDLGLGAHRNAVIVNTLLGRDAYAVRDRNVFQRFGAPVLQDQPT